ncbi:hypothetical protein K7711_10870 [Nocardia sp. CA2R105]|uniref:hypothetical protein n=1 Tax=Nocardia coffeae TaxID=2873381 RepID=UPI001CA64E67|nr:hypothetical protein [Nocardia coffeae]MBY8856980.1 hypothetical protein [Nocardia coffeae]
MTTPEPVKFPIDPESPPEFPGTMPGDVARDFCDRLQAIAEEANAYLGPEHQALEALDLAAHELMITTPFTPRYAEYDPEN